MYIYTAEEEQRGAIRFSADRRLGRRRSERTVKCPILRKKALLSWEEDITSHPEQKGTKRAWRDRKEEEKSRQNKIHRDLSLISGRLVREIRPLGKALYLACLRLPVIIIKAISPMATAEPFGKTSSEEEDKEGQNCWSKKKKRCLYWV